MDPNRDTHTLVIICERSTGDGVPCERCRRLVAITPELWDALQLGAVPLCKPCADRLARDHPGAFTRY